MSQLNIFEQINYNESREKLKKKLFGKEEESYRNARGELLPWEEPEYLRKLTLDIP